MFRPTPPPAAAYALQVAPRAQAQLDGLDASVRGAILERARALAGIAATAPLLFDTFLHAPLCFTLGEYRVTYAIHDASRVLEVSRIEQASSMGGEQVG